MRSPLSFSLATFVLLIAAQSPTLAQTAHVPADYPTIQAALTAGATTVYVSQGVYAETPVINHDVTLLPEPPADVREPIPFPVVTGLSIVQPSSTPNVYIRGFRFLAPVKQTNSLTEGGITIIEGCRMDGGFQATGQGLQEVVKIRGCVVTGDLFVDAYYTDVSGNMVWKGALTVHSNGAGAIIRDNIVMGPAPIGIASTSGDASGEVTRNLVTGATVGYSINSASVTGNVAIDCGGAGYQLDPTHASGSFSADTALRCAGSGISAVTSTGYFDIHDNYISSAGTYGIHVGPSLFPTTLANNVVKSSGSHGIWVENGEAASGNHVLLAGGIGIATNGTADHNVVGRSSLHGIAATGVSQNTSYLNGASGYDIIGSGTHAISNNIGYGNIAYGLLYAASGSATLACNDWFGNSTGATSGVAAGATDLAVNPLFCNLPADVVTLSNASPVLAAPGCGLIGALGAGCTSPTSVAPAPGEELGLRVSPNPSRGGVDLLFSASRQVGEVEIFDVQGARRFHANVASGDQTIRWSGLDARGAPVPAGVYFARRVDGSHTQTVRFVLER